MTTRATGTGTLGDAELTGALASLSAPLSPAVRIAAASLTQSWLREHRPSDPRSARYAAALLGAGYVYGVAARAPVAGALAGTGRDAPKGAEDLLRSMTRWPGRVTYDSRSIVARARAQLGPEAERLFEAGYALAIAERELAA